MLDIFKSLKVTNYQSHAETLLEFCSGINAIVGRTQAGKTAILRALKWLKDNSRGFRFHKHFADDPTELETSNHVFGRKRINKTNSGFYYLDGEELSGFGSGVPEEIMEALNLSEVNIQEQLEQPFLITASPPEVARVINKAIRLEDSAQWITELNSRVNAGNREVKRLKSEIGETEEELKEYIGLKEIETEIEKLKAIDQDIELLVEQEQELEVFITGIGNRTDAINSMNRWIKGVEQPLSKAIGLQKDIEQTNTIIDQLVEARTLSIKIENGKKTLLAEKPIQEAFELADKIKRIGRVIDSLFFYVESIDSATKSREMAFLALEEAKKDLFSAWKTMKRCPLCFSEMKIELIEKQMEAV